MSKIYLEEQRNKVTTWSATPSDSKYPSEALVARTTAIQQREIDNLKEALADTTTIQYPDTTYQKGTVPSGVCKYASVNKIIGASRKTKNLLPPSNKYGSDFNMDGVNFTKNNDGSWTLNGTTTQPSFIQMTLTNYDLQDICESISGKTITWSGTTMQGVTLNGGQYAIWLYGISNGSFSSTNGNTQTTVANASVATTFRWAIWWGNAGIVFNNAVIKPQLEVGSSATDYEPYFDGIKSATITKVTEVKNLLNPTLQTTTLNGVTCTKNADGTYTFNGTALSNCFFNVSQNTTLENGATYKLIGCPSGGSSSSYLIRPRSNSSDNPDTGSGAIFTSSSTFGDYHFTIRIASGYTCNNLIFKPMLTTDLTATYADFVKHEVHELTLPEPFIGRSAGNVADTYTPITGVIEEELDELDMGNLNWGYISAYLLFIADIPDGKIGISQQDCPPCVCSKYTNDVTQHYNTIQDKCIVFGDRNLSSSCKVLVRDLSAGTDATAFKTAMAGVKLIYPKATPTTRQVTPINPFIQCEGGGQLSLTHTESPATESRFVVEFANKQ